MNKTLKKCSVYRTMVAFLLLCIVIEIGAPACVFCKLNINNLVLRNYAPDSLYIKEYSRGNTASPEFVVIAPSFTDNGNDCDSPNDTHYLGRRSLRCSFSSNRFGNYEYPDGPILTAAYTSQRHLPSMPVYSSISDNSPAGALSNLRTVVLLN